MMTEQFETRVQAESIMTQMRGWPDCEIQEFDGVDGTSYYVICGDRKRNISLRVDGYVE